MTAPTLTDMMSARQVPVAGVYDCLTAAVCVEAGFPCLMLGGAMVAAASYGVPDLGLMSFGELYGVAARVLPSVEVPVIVDIDTGFGNELNVARTCERIAALGAAAVYLEDQTFPKRCGHLAGKSVVTRSEFSSKVRTASRVLAGTGTQLIARTDSLGVAGPQEAVARCCDALEAGADITFVEAPRTVADVESLANGVPGPKMFNLATGGRSPSMSLRDLDHLGFALVSVPGVSFMPVLSGVRRAAAAILRDGTDDVLQEMNLGPQDLFAAVGLDRWTALEAQVAGTPGEERGLPGATPGGPGSAGSGVGGHHEVV